MKGFLRRQSYEEEKKKTDMNLPTPIRNGFDFVGWYYNPQLTREYDGNIRKGKPLTLYAKWEKKAKPALTKEESINQILKDLNIIQNESDNVKIIKKYADNKAKFNDLSSTNINSLTIKKSVKLKMYNK